jgi:hypothetical protein
MQTSSIIPVLAFLGRNKSFIDLGNVAAVLGMFPDHLRVLVMDAEMKHPISLKIHDWQIRELLKIGERLGVIHAGTEFEIVPVQGEFNVHEQQQPTEDFLAYSKEHLAQKLGSHLLDNGLISFEVIPWQQVKQKNEWDRCWQLKASLKSLKEIKS